MPLIAGTSSASEPSAGSAGSAPSSTARARRRACASTTRNAMDGAQGPCAAAKRAAWLPGSSFTQVVHVALLVEGDRLGAMPGHRLEAHGLEQRVQLLGLRVRVLDEPEAVGAGGVLRRDLGGRGVVRKRTHRSVSRRSLGDPWRRPGGRAHGAPRNLRPRERRRSADWRSVASADARTLSSGNSGLGDGRPGGSGTSGRAAWQRRRIGSRSGSSSPPSSSGSVTTRRRPVRDRDLGRGQAHPASWRRTAGCRCWSAARAGCGRPRPARCSPGTPARCSTSRPGSATTCAPSRRAGSAASGCTRPRRLSPVMISPEVLAAFAAEQPGIQVELREDTSLPILRDLLEGRADLGIVTERRPGAGRAGGAALARGPAARGGAGRPSVRRARRRSASPRCWSEPLVGVLESGALSLLLEEAGAAPGPRPALPLPGGEHGRRPATSSRRATGSR